MLRPTLLTAVALCAPLPAQDAPQGMPDNSAQMKKLDWVVGTWVGSGEMAGYGKYTFSYELSWTLNRNFIKQDYWMKVGGKTIWHDTGMIGWDKDEGRYHSFNFGFDGTIGGGPQIPAKTAGVKDKKDVAEVLVFEGQTTGNSPWKKFRSIFLRIDADTIEMDTLSYKDGKYVSMGKVVAKRKKEKGAKKPIDGAPRKSPR